MLVTVACIMLFLFSHETFSFLFVHFFKIIVDLLFISFQPLVLHIVVDQFFTG